MLLFEWPHESHPVFIEEIHAAFLKLRLCTYKGKHTRFNRILKYSDMTQHEIFLALTCSRIHEASTQTFAFEKSLHISFLCQRYISARVFLQRCKRHRGLRLCRLEFLPKIDDTPNALSYEMAKELSHNGELLGQYLQPCYHFAQKIINSWRAKYIKVV